MKIPKFQNKLQFQEDFTTQVKNATYDDAEDALIELVDYIEPWEDGDHWLELTGDHTVSGEAVFFHFIADMPSGGLVLTYLDWAISLLTNFTSLSGNPV